MLTEKTPERDVIIACNPHAIPADMREQWVAAGKHVYAAVQEIQDLPDGYRFRLLSDSTLLVKVAEYISNERLCCAFLRFIVEIEPNGGPFWLCLTGGEGVKEYIRSLFETNKLLSIRLIK